MLQKIFETNPVALARLLRDQWNEFLDDYASRRLVSGPGIHLNRIWGSGTVISSTARGGSGDGSRTEIRADGGPFAVTVEDVADGGAESPEWIIRLHNSAGNSGYAGLVTIGSYREMIEDQIWDAEEGILYLDVAYDPETEEYDVIFDLETELPETGDEQRYILRIAEITRDEQTGYYTAHQIRDYGDIEVTGRWVK